MEQEQKNNAAKFAFFYMLSLAALIFMALSSGIIVFQIINKNIIDVLETFRGRYESGALKFAISAIIISAPIYYVMVAQINKNLFKGFLGKDSGVRKWLTYLILFISSLVMTGWLIATIYSFLDGELTTKFILKALTAIIISAIIFTYYFYDIKRENVVGVKDNIIRIYFYGSLVLVIAILISAFVFVESPTQTRNIKHDNNIIEKFSKIDNAINSHYNQKEKLPDNLDILISGLTYLRTEDLEDSATKKKFDYKIVDDKTYELCATFLMSSSDAEAQGLHRYYNKTWEYDKGYQCLEQEVRADKVNVITAPEPLRIE